MRKATVFNISAKPIIEFEVDRLHSFSSWFRAKHAVANCLLLIGKLLARIRAKINNVKFQNNDHYSKVTATNLESAEREIIKSLQSKHFRDEIMVLKQDLKDSSTKIKRMTLKKVSSLYRIDPFLDSFGILRVGGRIKRVNLSDVLKHPVILPRQSHITNLLIGHYHQAVNHMGQSLTTTFVKMVFGSLVDRLLFQVLSVSMLFVRVYEVLLKNKRCLIFQLIICKKNLLLLTVELTFSDHSILKKDDQY